MVGESQNKVGVRVKVYSTSSCPWCTKAKEYFEEIGVSFEEFDVSSDEEARNEMVEKSGQMGVPVIDINGAIIVGFDKFAIDSALSSAEKKRK